MSINKKLEELGITIPEVNQPAGNYVPAKRVGNLIFTSGQTPKKDGKLAYAGKLGADVSEKEGYEAARICAINCLSSLAYLAGGLDNVKAIVKATCFISSDPSFYGQANVANGATDLLTEVFGRDGTPARSAIGMAVLPGNAAVEVELVCEVKDASLCKAGF